MNLTIVFHSISLIAIMIFIGTLLAKSIPFNEDAKKVFVNLILNIAMPCIILSSILKVEINSETFKNIMIVLVFSIVINTLGITLGWISSYKLKREVAILSGLGNTGFIGIPLCSLLFGPEGALYAAIFDVGVDITIWTIGVILLQKSKFSIEYMIKNMINIPNLAIILGLLISYLQWSSPVIIIDLTEHFADLGSPLAMFYIGILLTTLKKEKVKNFIGSAWLPIFIKLIMLPILTAILLVFLNVSSLIFKTVFIQSMMPCLTLSSILFAKYTADEEFGAFTTILSTLLALFTIPSLIIAFNYLLSL